MKKAIIYYEKLSDSETKTQNVELDFADDIPNHRLLRSVFSVDKSHFIADSKLIVMWGYVLCGYDIVRIELFDNE